MGKAKRYNSYDSAVAEQRKQVEAYGNIRQAFSGITSSFASSPKGTPMSVKKSTLLDIEKGAELRSPLGFTATSGAIDATNQLDLTKDSSGNVKKLRGLIFVSSVTSSTLDEVIGKLYDGQIVILTGISGQTAITITHASGVAGQILCPGDTNYTLSDDESVILVHDVINATQPTWRMVTGSGTGGATALNNLSDVTITAVANNDILRYNGSAWVNSSTGVFTTLSATSSFSSTGSTTLGDTTADPINFVGRVNTDFVPKTDNAHDLGSATREWKDLYIDGTANIDTLISGIGSFTTSLSSTGTTTLGDNATDAINIVGNIDTDINIDAGSKIKAYDSQEIGFQVTNDSMTVGTEGSIQVPHGGAPGTASAADTDFGNVQGCIGIQDTGSGSLFLYVRQADGNWAAVALTRDTLT
jgi:hypothetical protein